MHGTHRATRQEYAIKVLDKGHLKRNNKLNTALAEKSTLVRLGSGPPGIVRLHWAFQDDWSLCESASYLLPRFAEGETATPLRWVTTEEGQGNLVSLGFIPPFAS
jgi:serine/threonine protein kinase